MEKEDYISFLSKLRLFRSDLHTHIVLIVIHNEEKYNDISKIYCKNLSSMKGYPSRLNSVGGYAYDGVTDSYLVNCIDLYTVGSIPFSLKVKMDDVGHWLADVPLPVAVIRKYLPQERLDLLDKFLKSYDGKDFSFQYLQFIDVC